MTASLFVAIGAIAVLTVMSVVAHAKVAPGVDRLAMHWSLRGKPHWTLPRPIALGFAPAIATLALLSLSLTGVVETWLIATLGAALILGHALYIALLARLS